MQGSLYTKRLNQRNVIILMALLVLIILAFVSFIFDKSTPSDEITVSLSVYEKIKAAEPVNVLIIGDSIAEGTGATSGNSWAQLFSDWINEKCGDSSVVTNVSMGGNTSYAGIVRNNILDDGIDYDLVIICYGENDADDDTFAPTYEGMIRNIYDKYRGCDIICVLESSQREYTNKIRQIMEIAEYYGIPVADTIAAFAESGYEYDELVGAPDDLTHPNNLGHYIYYQTVTDLIDNQIEKIHMYSLKSSEYDTFRYYSKKDFKRVGIRKFLIRFGTPVTADLGIYRSFIPGENDLKIYVDNELLIDQNVNWNYSFGQAHIDQLSEEAVHIENSLVVEFGSREQAKYFEGIILSNIE